MGMEVEGVDVWVGIYSPDQPFFFKENVVADFFIRNEETRK